MQHINSQTRQKIQEEIGASFEFISFSAFEVEGERRTHYTVRKERGEKLYHLIGYENGVIRLA